MPPELNKKDIEKIIALGHWEFLTKFQTKEIASFFGRPVLTTITDYLKKAGISETPLKYILYSHHDCVILSIMTLLQNPLNELVPYTGNLNFSLFKTDSGTYLVKISYNGKPVIIPGCGTKGCTLEQFTKFTSSV